MVPVLKCTNARFRALFSRISCGAFFFLFLHESTDKIKCLFYIEKILCTFTIIVFNDDAKTKLL